MTKAPNPTMNTKTPKASAAKVRVTTIITMWVRRHPRRSRALATAIAMLLISVMTGLRCYAPVHVKYSAVPIKVNGPVTLELDQTLGQIETAKIAVTPKVEGTWQYKRGNVFANDTLVFTPTHYFTANTRYRVAFPVATRMIAGTVSVPGVSFMTEKAPSLAQGGVAAWQQNQTIAMDAAFTINLATQNHGLRALELRSTPEIKLVPSVQNDTTYTWKPTELLPADTAITVEIFDTKINESLVKRTVHVAAAPALTSPQFRSGIDEHDSIPLTFAEAIDQSTAKISFDLAGKGTWQNDTTYMFMPDTVVAGTTYSYTIAQGLRSKDGGITPTDLTGGFSTIGAVQVIATTPHGYELSQSQQTLSFTFDRPVDHRSAEQRLSVSSGNVTGISWKGNTFYATVTNLGFQNTFSASIAAGVANTSFGLPSNQPYTLSFTTEIRSVKLAVPYYSQQHAGTCTAASLRMALAYRGISSDEMELVNAMGYNPRNIDKSTNPPTWDDPQTMFVGFVDGSITAGTGAGPDAPPVVKAARAFGRGADSVTGISASWIAQQIYNGNPVIMFGAYRNTGTTTWQTPDGQKRIMNLTGHTSVVVGVKGEPSAPLGFWINDPLKGAVYWTASQVSANIAMDPDRQAVVVY